MKPAEPPQDAFGALALRAGRIADVLLAITRRRPALEFRARTMLELLERRCPLVSNPSRPWYVRGAVARVGLPGMARVLGRDRRVLRRHFRTLEDACLIVRSPGDWVPMRETAAMRSRFPDTIHVVDTELEALWWMDVGDRRLAHEPGARSNPETWARTFGRWRDEALEPSLFERPEVAQLRALQGGGCDPGVTRTSSSRSHRGHGDVDQRVLPFGRPDVATPATPLPEQPVRRCELDAAELLAVSMSGKDPLDLLQALERAGAKIEGRNAALVAGDLERLRRVVARLAASLEHGSNIENAAGWIVSAWKQEARRGSLA